MVFKLRFPKLTPFFILVIFLLVSCGGSGGKKNTTEVTVDSNELEKDIFKDISNAKQIFYSLPSPLESAMLIKSAGASFNDKILNPLTNVNKYSNNKDMAINLGVYITDLSYASMFDQAQITIKYMEAARKMADGLGITEAIDQNTINRLEENINNRDVILDIISESFMSSTAFLKENDRQPLATISLVGGWIEGLYLATQLVGDGPIQGNKIVGRIVDQKLSLDMVLKLLNNNKENKDVKEITALVQDLKKSYDKIIIKSSKIQTVVDEKSKETNLKSTSSSNINQELFTELKQAVKTIRTNFTL
jgi:predicted Zn-ribbon and HTH transcriptional regulator